MTNTSSTFQPANQLEHALVEAQEGRLLVESFLNTLHSSQVYILIDKDLGPNGWDNSASPMVLNNSSGKPVLAMFTSPTHSEGWPQRYPQFTFGLLTDFRWLLKGVAPSVGVVINPGTTFGLELSPERVAELKARSN